MANTQSMCTSFLGELMTATHNFGVAPTRGTTAADTFKAALYFASATINASTTVYSATGEIGNSGSYSAGGTAVTNANPPASASGTPATTAGTGYWTPSANVGWTGVTAAAFDTLLLYNSTQSNKAVSVHTFGSQTITSGNITITMPTNAAATALLRLVTT